MQRDHGARKPHGHDMVSAQNPSALWMVGSPGIVDTDHLLTAFSALRPPRVCAPLGALAAPASHVPRPRYLVESDCIQGKGTLGVQAAAPLRSGEEQKEQERGK